jgi:NAD(P)-dependent dehydrogenase (short-subunit alcohol dehydrogenase family)
MLPVETIRDVSMESFRRIYDINLFSVVSLVQQSLPHLAKSPSKPTIVIVTSGVDLDVLYRGWTGYCSSKAALTRFIQLLAHEEPEMNIFGVLPKVTKSPMVDMIFAGKYDHVMLPEEREKFNRWAKEGMIEPPEYIARSMVKAAMGELTPRSPEVERNVCGALFVGSLYEKEVLGKSRVG